MAENCILNEALQYDYCNAFLFICEALSHKAINRFFCVFEKNVTLPIATFS